MSGRTTTLSRLGEAGLPFSCSSQPFWVACSTAKRAFLPVLIVKCGVARSNPPSRSIADDGPGTLRGGRIDQNIAASLTCRLGTVLCEWILRRQVYVLENAAMSRGGRMMASQAPHTVCPGAPSSSSPPSLPSPPRSGTPGLLMGRHASVPSAQYGCLVRIRQAGFALPTPQKKRENNVSQGRRAAVLSAMRMAMSICESGSWRDENQFLAKHARRLQCPTMYSVQVLV